MHMRRALAAAAALGTTLLLAAAAFALPPFTNAPKTDGGSGGQAVIDGLRTSCHGSFDRLVIEARRGVPSYDARYVRRVRSDGSGAIVRLKGSKRLRIVMQNARAHSQAGGPLIPGAQTPLCPNLRQVKLAGDFEGVVTFGVGLRRKDGFRVFRLSNPARVVVDVAH